MMSARRTGAAVLAAAFTLASAVVAATSVAATAGTTCPPPARPHLALASPLQLWGPDHNGNWHIAGAVDNRGPGAAAEVAVGYTVSDAAGRPIVTDRRFVWSNVLAAGQESGFDSPLFRPDRRPASVRAGAITWTTPTTVAHRFPVTVGSVAHQSGSSFGRMTGAARNDLTVPVFSIAISATLRDAAGRVVGIVPGTTEDDFSGGQQPGAWRSWTMNIDPAVPAWSTYTIEAVSDQPAGAVPVASPCLPPLPRVPAQVPVAPAERGVAAIAPHTVAPSIPRVTAVATPPAPVSSPPPTHYPPVVPNAETVMHRADRTPWLVLALVLAVVVGFLTSLVAGRRAPD